MRIPTTLRQRSLALLVVCGACLWTMTGGAAVYKTTDEDGNVLYTDTPPSGPQAQSIAETVDVAPANIYAAPTTPNTPRTTEPGSPMALTLYESLSIIQPAPDQAVRENAGNVTITARVAPRLAPGHRVRILLDGETKAVGERMSVALTNVDRGSHSVQAQIVDQQEQVLISSAPVTFHMLRFSALSPARR